MQVQGFLVVDVLPVCPASCLQECSEVLPLLLRGSLGHAMRPADGPPASLYPRGSAALSALAPHFYNGRKDSFQVL